MLLPNRQQAFVAERKLTHYLLSLSHPVGGPKARFFRGHGFTKETSALLKEELLQLARKNEVRAEEATPHGTKYVVEGLIDTPHGTTVAVRTVWMIERERSAPRFVTAYPA